MSSVALQEEPIRALWAEMWPLLCAHWREIATWQDIQLDPDMDAYEAMAEAGMLRVFTARDEGRLIGYAAYVVRTHLHYMGSKQAVQDVIYLSPKHRRGRLGIRLMQHADAALAEDGVQVVYHHVKLAHDFGPVLERMGYTLVEKVYARRL
jgi:L-amino acid N-acyltransferase YncA